MAFAATVIALAAATAILVRPIAPQFTGNVAFDEKIKFIRDHGPEWREPVNVVLGSSMALNNVETDILQQREHRPFVNLGAWAMTTADSSKLLSQFEREHPVKDVIFVTQFMEMIPNWTAQFMLSDDDFHAYVAEGSWLVDVEHRDFWMSLSLRFRWKRDYLNSRRYETLKFSQTGAVAIDIGSDMERRKISDSYPAACDNCMASFDAFCKATVAKGHSLAFVLPPIDSDTLAHRPDVQAIATDRIARLRSLAAGCGAKFLDASRFMNLDTSCFADALHLNRGGMQALSELIAKWQNGVLVAPQRIVHCVRSPDRGGQIVMQ